MKPLESSLPYSSGLGMGNIMDWELYSGGNVRVLCRADSEAVRIAARNLVKDIEKVTFMRSLSLERQPIAALTKATKIPEKLSP